ncbi:molybdopterin oxidoreductase family protein [Opitutus terrae]|uniref:Molybdopterin oxidoreductase n=1 Tax=Opitutus terrae (strain DSM 11246 / JCM 15787 / PB90-1) TaxID=452637 RepID=B1ZVT8_OPITP|nr:nitrate reductase [Opitutus terrae]ACB75024.1 molybdopterin oxidoreductase [Opitutus terrae PB90-1]
MSTIAERLRAQSGPMTSELVQRPSDFGLGRLPSRLAPAATITSVCGFCSTGCGLKIHLNDRGEAINLTADPGYPVNLGMACPKGWEALTPLVATDRATTPLLRDDASGRLVPVSWSVALAAFVQRFRSIQERSGKAAVAVLSTGQIVTEEMALLGALAKFGMGVRHLDSNTRQCMATSHVAYKQAFGFDAPPFTYADLEESDALIFIGANPCIAHPILWQRVTMNRRNPDIVVIDPRRTETAEAATLHVPLRPKSDLVLLYGLARRLIERGAVDQAFGAAHTSGFEAFAEFVAEFTVDRVVRDTGLPREMLERLVEVIATRERVSFWWTMGVNQSHEATRTAQAIINLALMTGNIGRPGTGANSITGQCNAMGSRLFGNATSLLGGYDFARREHRAHVARVLQIDPAVIPEAPGLAYDQILDAIERGEIRGLWIVATNTAHSWIGSQRFAALRERLEFLVVQDMYATTETAQLADLVLPAAGWGEKDGVIINSERRLGLVRKVARAPGEALSDFAILKLIAEGWGCGEMFRRWSSPAAVFQILKEVSRGQPCDFSGVRDYWQIEEEGGIQWPRPDMREMPNGECRGSTEEDTLEGSHSTFDDRHSSFHERRLFEDGKFFTQDGRARFFFEAPRPMPEPPDPEYPFLLMTGRGSSAQWHTGTRTNKSAVLRKLAPQQLYAEINPADAARLGVVSGGIVRVISRRGSCEALAFVTATVQRGHVFLPMHFAPANRLTFPSFDPHSRQPSYKAAAVRIEPRPC